MNKPFLLTPAYKDYLWGGTRLNDYFEKGIDAKPLAETWECSTHPDGQSKVTLTNELLGEAISKNPDWIGSHPMAVTGGKFELPIIIKLIDADSNLSVQVHPDDDYALKNENSLGKTEMWYVIEAKPGAELIYGFNRDMDEQKIKKAIEKGTIEKYLNHVPIHKDDVFYIEAGTVHAIGAGTLVAEIQEASNITYRLYDYNRVDKNGNKRKLNIENALKVANLKSSKEPRQPIRVLKYQKGCASELLSRCKYFQVERLVLNTESHRELTDFKTDETSFHALLCTDGCGVLFGEGVMLNFFKGDCIFVPANSIPLKLHGKAQLLNVSC